MEQAAALVWGAGPMSRANEADAHSMAGYFATLDQRDYFATLDQLGSAGESHLDAEFEDERAMTAALRSLAMT